MTIRFYGIPNCDTVKKARKWLEAQGLDYEFHDYKKEGADPARLKDWVEQRGWEVLLNTRGTTFRKLDDAEKENLDADKAVVIMQSHPSTIKRPVVEHDGPLLVGFKEAEWKDALA